MIDLTERYELIKAISERLKEQPNKPKRIKSSTSKQNNRIRRIAKWCLEPPRESWRLNSLRKR